MSGLLIVGSLVAGCAGGTLKHSESYHRFRDYLHHEHFKAFAQEETGGAAYAWSSQKESAAEAVQQAVATCERVNGGDPCHVYALGNKVVWRLPAEEIRELTTRYQDNPSLFDE